MGLGVVMECWTFEMHCLDSGAMLCITQPFVPQLLWVSSYSTYQTLWIAQNPVGSCVLLATAVFSLFLSWTVFICPPDSHSSRLILSALTRVPSLTFFLPSSGKTRTPRSPVSSCCQKNVCVCVWVWLCGVNEIWVHLSVGGCSEGSLSSTISSPFI